MTYIPQPIVTEGGERKISVVDSNLEQLFTDVLKELKKMNIQLSLINDIDIKDQEIG